MWHVRAQKEVIGGMGSGSLGLHLKDTHKGEFFIISKNWLTLAGAVLSS